MNILLTIFQAIQILAAIGMIGLILMQHGKGADAGAAFGGGGAGSASLFGASGGANFLSRTTAVLAAVFLACTLGLAYFGNHRAAASTAVVPTSSRAPPPCWPRCSWPAPWAWPISATTAPRPRPRAACSKAPWCPRSNPRPSSRPPPAACRPVPVPPRSLVSNWGEYARPASRSGPGLLLCNNPIIPV